MGPGGRVPRVQLWPCPPVLQGEWVQGPRASPQPTRKATVRRFWGL